MPACWGCINDHKMLHHVTAAVANCFRIPNVSCGDDDLVANSERGHDVVNQY